MADGIEVMLPPYRENVDRGYKPVMTLAVLREDPPLYWVAEYSRSLDQYLGFNRGPNKCFNLRGRKISAENLNTRLKENNSSLNHLRCQRSEDSDRLITILMNENSRL